MEINKQLFEDILSGKLKGTFVLRNGDKVNSKELKRNNSYYSKTHPYQLVWSTYTSNGKTSLYDYTLLNDIIDFIPDTNMKKNELTIEIPDGKIVDWEESKKQNKLVFKNKQLTYGDICKELFKNCLYYITDRGKIDSIDNPTEWMGVNDSNNASTKYQLECLIAKNKLANVAMFLNNGWVPNNDKYDYGWIIYYDEYNSKLKFAIADEFGYDSNVLFKTKELAKQAIEILGEETTKLALEPLGFVKTK